MFGDNEEGIGDGLMWVDEIIQEALQQSMDSGDLEDVLQPEHPDIVAIRYIPPGTELPTNSKNPDGAISTPIGGRSTALSWVLIGFGLIILLGVFLYTLISRRHKREQDERTATVVGAFPVVVSRHSVSQFQKAQEREQSKYRKPMISKQSISQVQMENMRDEAVMSKRSFDTTSPHFLSLPPELLGRNYSESDDSEGDEEIPLHVFQDDDTPPSRTPPHGISTSWRAQILRNSYEEDGPFGGGISLDPNQPLVRPILDEETDRSGHRSPPERNSAHSRSSQYHSVYSDDYPSSFYAGSSLTDSPTRPSQTQQTPSKLTAAFDQSEII